ncbi:MAG TPA: hypothetical protein PKC69_04345 [Chitinophagaceae bacterium]|nr:hypothetical protein [Chitinophagaceae bacterium]
MSFEKENFLRTRLTGYLQQLRPDASPLWGKMSVQHMIEHLGRDAFRTASGRLKFDTILLPANQVAAMQEFIMTNRPFKKNIKNPLMPEEPGTLHYKTIQAAIGSLHQELIYFFEAFEKNPQLITRNPFYGDLNFDQNVRLLYKHSLHHLAQFGVIPPGT